MPVFAHRIGHGQVIKRGRRDPDVAVAQILLLRSLQHSQRKAGGQVHQDGVRARGNGLQQSRVHVRRAGVQHGHGTGATLGGHIVDHGLTGPDTVVGNVQANAGDVFRPKLFLSILRRTQIRGERALVGRHQVRRLKALGNRAGRSHGHDALIDIGLRIHRHFGERSVAHHGHGLFVIHQLGGRSGGSLGIPLVIFDMVFNGPPVDPAIGVHAGEIGCRSVGRRRPIPRRAVREDAADDDRGTRGGLPGICAARRRSKGGPCGEGKAKGKGPGQCVTQSHSRFLPFGLSAPAFGGRDGSG